MYEGHGKFSDTYIHAQNGQTYPPKLIGTQSHKTLTHVGMRYTQGFIAINARLKT